MIADDHAPQRMAVRMALETEDFKVVGESADADSAYEAALKLRPDVCLLDIHMPGNGIEAARRIVDKLPGVSVVMLTVSRNNDDLFDSLKAGAAGYLLKDIDPKQLPEALHAVLQGEAALPMSLIERLVEEFRDRSQRKRFSPFGRREVRLSDEEWKVLELLKEGLSTADIGDRLFISPGVVRSNVTSILTKLRETRRP